MTDFGTVLGWFSCGLVELRLPCRTGGVTLFIVLLVLKALIVTTP